MTRTTTLFFFSRYFTYEQLCCLIKYQAFTFLLLSSFTFAPLLSFTPSLQLQCFFLFLSFFFLHFFTSIASSHLLLLLSFFLFFFQLFTLMLLRVLLYFFMGLFVFESVGFVWAYAKEGETTVGFLFMGCVFVRWLGCVSWVFKGWDQWVWVVGSGRRRSGASFGSGSNQVQQLWVSSENSWEFSLGFLYLYPISIYWPK